jgi:hypothetical protein
MAVVDFDLATAGKYVGSFSDLHQSLGGRAQGHVVELKVALPGGSLNLFLEAASLYLVAVRSPGGIQVLDGGKEQSYLPYFPEKEYGKGVVKTGIPARYDSATWKLAFTMNDLSVAAGLPGFIAAGNHAAAKAAVDRLAFAISEAARFIPIRCAVACEIADDLEFKEVIVRLVTWAGKFVAGERNVSGSKKMEELSSDDARLRRRLGDQNMKVFRVNENLFQNLTGAAKWLAMLESSQEDWDETDKQRMRALRTSSPRVQTLRLGDFKTLIANWEKFSAIAHRDPNFIGLLDAFHIRYTAGAVSAEESLTLAEWR